MRSDGGLGDGYQRAQLDQYQADVQAFVDTLLRTPPFDELRMAINVHRVDIASTDAGADDPIGCGGSGSTARTYLDAAFCGDGTNRRLLVVNNQTALAVAETQVPEYNAVLVAVNSTVYGGAGGAVGTFSRAAGAAEIAMHELGHTAFGLADEYEYWRGCGVDTDRDNHPAGEPSESNVTTNANRATLKWRHLVAATTPVPTTRNPDCSRCDPQASPVASGTVGLFEGAHYYHCGAYRPEFDCKMRTLGRPFCAVCRERIRALLVPFSPMPLVDHLALYRPGTGTIWILRNSGGSFTPVYAQGAPGAGIGGYDLQSPADRAFAFDYNGSGKLDHLALYRPGTGTIWILRNSGGSFTPVYAQGAPGAGIGGYDLQSPADRAFAFDY